MTDLVQIGVIGTGGMGERHARNLAHHTPGAAVTAVMDLDTEAAAAIARDCDGATVHNAAAALINDPRVAAVVIASPDPTHAGLARACIAAGKPVLCEKPLASTVADAKGVIDAEVAGGKRLVQLGFMREFDDAHRRVRELTMRGDMGEPLYFRGTHTNLAQGAPRTVEDVIINSAIHDIHSARWFLGGRVTETYGRHMPVPGAGDQSCRFLLVNLTFADGKMALIEVNVDADYGYEVRTEVMCERGTARSDGLEAIQVRRQQSAGLADRSRLAGALRSGVQGGGAGLGSVHTRQAAGWPVGLGRLHLSDHRRSLYRFCAERSAGRRARDYTTRTLRLNAAPTCWTPMQPALRPQPA